MISRQHRFHGHASLSFVYRRGVTARNQFMALRYVYNPRRTTYRLAVIVSRKIHKSAVQRNRVRRRLYAIVQQQEDRITEPCDLVLTVYSDQVVSLPQPELEELVVGLLLKAGIIPSPITSSLTPAHDIVNKTSEEL